MTKPGTRVGAFLSKTETSVVMLGYGVHEGDHVPPRGTPGIFLTGFPNPRIRLDDGRTVWGCQCWWGPEEKVRAMVKDLVQTQGVVEQEVTES